MCLLRGWLVAQPHYMSLALTALVCPEHSGNKVEREAKAHWSWRRWGCALWPDLFRVLSRPFPVLRTSEELVTPLEIWDPNSSQTPFLDRHLLSFVPFLAHRGDPWQLWVGQGGFCWSVTQGFSNRESRGKLVPV